MARSTSTYTERPWVCRSLATSSTCGSVFMRSMSRGSQTGNSSGLASTRTNWYWVRLTVVSMLRSWTGCMNSETPPTAATSRRRRRMTSLAVAARSSRGLRLIRKRPVLSVGFVPSTPMNDERLTTSGSFRIRAARACCSSAMRANETDCEASEIPWISPVSCTGKKPLGMTT